MADLALLGLTIAWGTTFLVVKRVLAGTSPALFLCLRFALAALALGALWLARRRVDRPTPGLLRHGLLLGLAMAGGFLLQTEGLRLTTPARSGFLTGLAVLIVPLLQRFLLGRRVARSAWLAVVLALLGLATLTRPFADGVGAAVRLGDLLTVGCAAAFAFQILFTSSFSRRHPVTLLTLLQIAVTLAAAALLLPFEPLALAPTPGFAAAVVFTGVVMTAGAFFVQNWAQRRTTAVRAAIIFSLEPVAAALFAHWVGGEPLGRAEWLGGGLIVAGVFVGEIGAALEQRARRPSGPWRKQ